jgi:hypothetical protein
MIPLLPGWLNFIVLAGIYLVPVKFIDKLLGLETLGGQVCVVLFFAGGYLSKYRFKTFNGLTNWAWLVAGLVFVGMLAYIIFG